VPIDWETINEKEAQEIENESARSGGGGGSHK
jgi:hypothetical protein